MGLSFLFLSFLSCATVKTIRHPDYNFYSSTPWQDIKIYQGGFEPTYPYLIIAKLEKGGDLFMPNPPSNPLLGSWNSQLKKAAANAGGDGILITNKDVNMQEYNQLVTRGSISSYTGFCNLKGLSITSYTETTSIEKRPTYIWVIKRVQR